MSLTGMPPTGPPPPAGVGLPTGPTGPPGLYPPPHFGHPHGPPPGPPQGPPHPGHPGHHPHHVGGPGGRAGMTTYYRTISVDNKPTTVIIGPNGEPIKLPESLESLPKSDHFPSQRHRWNTNEEIASMLIAFDRHMDWLSKEVKIRPKSGSMLLYSRKKVRYRRDGYCWKKRKDGKTTREDHMKLKVQGMECIYGCYVHSAILPTFHRRCYWLLQNPDIVLVHYLNVPYPDDNKLVIASSVSLWSEKKEWTKEELISQLKPMFFSEEDPDLNNELEISTAETVEAIVTQLMEKQRAARAAALNKQLECGCPPPDSTADKGTAQTCIHQHQQHLPAPNANGRNAKVQATKSEAHTTSGSGGSVTPTGRAPSSRGRRGGGPYVHGSRGGAMRAARNQENQGFSQVSSTTGNIDASNNNSNNNGSSRQSPESSSPMQQHHHQMQHHGIHPVMPSHSPHHTLLSHAHPQAPHPHGQLHNLAPPPHLVLTVGGLPTHPVPGQPPPPTQPQQPQQQGLLVVNNSATNGTDSQQQLNGLSDNSGDSNSSPVSSAVRSLNTLSDFASLDHMGNANGHSQTHLPGGGYDSYSVTDSLLSDGGSSVRGGPKDKENAQQQPGVGSGPLLDFKTAFTDVENKPPGSDMSFLHDPTLSGHMSQEDIHRTLQANMPPHPPPPPPPHTSASGVVHPGHASLAGGKHVNGHAAGGHAVDMNPMDFIENDVVATPPGNHTGHFDIDAFDMLGEFSPPGSEYMLGSGGAAGAGKLAGFHPHVGRELVHVTDYSPEWAWTDGGSKLLLVGPWTAHNPGDKAPQESSQMSEDSSGAPDKFTVSLDGDIYPAEMVQSGVIRCILPARDAGNICLEVLRNGSVISHPVIFKYKDKTEDAAKAADDGKPGQAQHDDAAAGHHQEEEFHQVMRYALLGKLEKLSDKMLELGQMDFTSNTFTTAMELKKKEATQHCMKQSTSKYLEGDAKTVRANFFEEVLADYVEKFRERNIHQLEEESNEVKAEKEYALRSMWADDIEAARQNAHGLTLLHMAAALGYKSLCQKLLRWTIERPVLTLQTEIDPLAQDHEGCTPLMRACMCGQTATALYLYEWNSSVMKVRNYDGESCFELAMPFEHLCHELRKREAERVHSRNKASSSGNETVFAKPGGIKAAFSKKCRAASLDESRQYSPGLGTPGASPNCLGSGNVRKLRSTSPAASTSSSGSGALPFHQPLSINCDLPAAPQHCRMRRLSKRSSFDSGINLHPSHHRELLLQQQKGLSTCKKDAKIVPKNPNMKSKANFLKDPSDSSAEVPLISESSSPPGSPYIDVEGLSSEDDDLIQPRGEKMKRDGERPVKAEASEDDRVLSLAEQFIAAMPDRIKNESELEPMVLCPQSPHLTSPHTHCNNASSSNLSSTFSQSDDLGVESMADDLDLADLDLDFDFSNLESNPHPPESLVGDTTDGYTPLSSLSPSSSCLHSPASYSAPSPMAMQLLMCGPGVQPQQQQQQQQQQQDASPTGTTQDMQEFLQASLKCERDLSNLTLSDQEQRELYEAAQIIQKAYRSYKGRKKATEYQEKEAKAAVVIQNYYRRYKQYLYWKQMAKAATVIQTKYRTYCEHKRFKKSQEVAAMCIQSYYRTYKEHQVGAGASAGSSKVSRGSREGTPSAGLKRTYSQRRQHQAAKKIQQFMRKTHLKPIDEVFLRRAGASERASSGSNANGANGGPNGTGSSNGSGCFSCRKREAPCGPLGSCLSHTHPHGVPPAKQLPAGAPGYNGVGQPSYALSNGGSPTATNPPYQHQQHGSMSGSYYGWGLMHHGQHQQAPAAPPAPPGQAPQQQTIPQQ